MQEGSTGVEDAVSLIHRRVDLVVDGARRLDIKHQVGHCIVLVAQVVVLCVHCALVEVPVPVLRVTSFLVSVAHPVKTIDDLVLIVDDLAGCWCDIERHAIVSLDIHKRVVHAQQGVRKWASPKVTVHLLECPVSHDFFSFFNKFIINFNII